jgi:hypothetical protein
MMKQFFTCLIHFLFQNIKEFPRVSIHSVSKTQRSNGAWSRSLPPCFTQLNDATSRPSWRSCTSSMMQSLQWVTPIYLVSCHDNQKTVSGGQKPILAVLWPAWACVWQCWHVAAHLPLQLPRTRKKLRQRITFEEVQVHAGRSHTLLGDSGFMRDKWLIDCDNLFKHNLSAVI